MFDIDLPDPSAVDALGDAQLVDAVIATSKLESQLQSRRLHAIAELWDRRKKQFEPEREDFVVDPWDAVSAELSAAIGVTSSRASGMIRIGEALRDRLPKVAAVFARGEIDMAMVYALVHRTELVEDPESLVRIDQSLADRAPGWTKYSRKKIAEYIDSWVGRFDPVAVREPSKPTDNRYLDVTPSGQGMAGIYGNLHVPDAIVFDGRINDLVATVCADDPRTRAQLRADAVRALADRLDRMPCSCGNPECGGKPPTPPRDVVIHVLTEPSTVDGGEGAPGYVSGFGPIAADTIRTMAKSARRKPLIVPSDPAPERGYRPSVALDEFVRLRDLVCRFPGCDVPAAFCDVDHTVPFSLGGPTHPSNLKCECRRHHLLKTFYSGADGWSDRQSPDGTVHWVSPTGHVYATKPGGMLYFPVLGHPTGEVAGPTRVFVPHPERNAKMPRRQRSRSQDRSRRRCDERQRNADRLDAQSRERTRRLVRESLPPPF
jgi:hypothetical protein